MNEGCEGGLAVSERSKVPRHLKQIVIIPV